MKYVRAVVDNVVGLFVTDWTQTVGIVVILVVGYLGVKRVPSPLVGFGVAALLGLHLVYTTFRESRGTLARS